MSLQVWIPGTENLNNQGLSSSIITQGGTYISSGGKIGKGCINASNMTINYGPGKAANLTSVTFWHKWNGTVPTGWVTTFHFPYNSGEKRYYLATNESHFYPAFVSSGGNTKFTLDSNWHHIALIGTDSKLIVYIDGIEDCTIPGNAFTLEGNAYFSNCYLNDIRIYDYSLSSKEVHEIAKGLVLHYPMNDLYVLSTVYDCSGYCNNGIVKELKASTINLVTSLSSGGQTTVSGNKIITSGQNADTYFTINLSESIVKNLMYTLSCIGENIPTNGKFGFPLGKLSNTSLHFWIKNGYNEFTFVANDIDWGSKILFMDDAGRDTAYMNLCIFKDFKLYKHEVLNSGLNMISESPRYNKSCKFNGVHDIKLSNPFGERTMDELTVVFWHKPNVNSSRYKSICSNEYPHSGFWISANCEGSPLWWYGGGFYCRGTGITISNDIWYHIAITFKNNIYQWYLNGNPVPTTTSGTFKAPIFTNILSIGGNSSGNLLGGANDYRLNGCLSDFRIYSTALSDDDIKELYNTSAIINNNNTLESYEFSEANTYSINKSGVLEGAEFIEQDGEVLINNTEQVFATEFTEI